MPTTLPFVGRTHELALLDQIVGRAAAGVGESVLLLGEPGIGKSRLADECATLARKRGFTVTWGRCWEAGGAPEFWPWTQALRGLVRATDPQRLDALDPPGSPRRQLLAGLVPELVGPELGSGVGPEFGNAGTGDAERFELLDAVASWLTNLAREPGPAVWIGLEDLHAGDAATLALLEFLAPQLRAARIVVIGTARDSELGPAGTATLVRRVARCSTQLQLPRLSGADIRSFLAAAFTERRLSPAVEQAVETTTEGNALFLVEAARLLRTMGPKAELGGLLPATVRGTLEGRIAKLAPGTRAVLEHAALFGREFEVDSLRAAFGLHGIEPALVEASEAAIVTPIGGGCWRFSHIRIPEVIALGIENARRCTMHAAIARELEGRKARAAELAHHLLRAGPSCREAALAACRRAAENAHRRFAYEDASAHLGRARAVLAELELDPEITAGIESDLDTADGLSLLAGGAIEAGHERCERAFARAAVHNDGVRMAEAALAYGSEFSFAHVDGRLVEMLEAVLGRLSDTRPALEARVLARLAAARQPADDPRAPIALARRAIALARESGDEDALADALRNGCSTMVDLYDPLERIDLDRELYELARRRGRRVDEIRGLTRMVFGYFELGRHHAGMDLLDQAIVACGERAPRRHQWRQPSFEAMRALWIGDFDRATKAIAEVELASAGPGGGEARTAALFQAAWLAQINDDRATLTELLPRMRRVFKGSDAAEWISRARYGECLVWLGRIDEARALLSKEFIAGALQVCDRSSVESLASLALACEHQPLAQALLDYATTSSQRLVHSGIVGMHLRSSIDHTIALAHQTLGQREQALAALRRAIAFAVEHRGRPSQVQLEALLARWTKAAPAPAPAPTPTPSKPSAELPRLELRGAIWELEFAGHTTTVRANKGVAIIAELIRRPGVEVHVLDLVHPDSDRARVDQGDAGELLDAEARAAYRRRAESLAGELAEAERFNDLARTEQLRAELDALAEELSRGVGLSGSSRRAAGAAERARVNVRKRLRHAIRAIAEVHPELGRHLDATIRTGTFCEYRPL